MIGPGADPAVACVDKGEAQIGRIQRKTGEHARDTAGRRHHKRRRGMGELVMFPVIDRVKSKCFGSCAISFALPRRKNV